MKSVPDPSSHEISPGAFGGFGRPNPEPPKPIPDATSLPAAGADLVYEMAPLAYLNFDRQGRITGLNLAAARLLGADRRRDIKRPLVNFFSPRDAARLLGHVERSRSSRAAVTTRLELRKPVEQGSGVEMSTRPASAERPYRTQLVPLAAGKPVAWLADDTSFRALVENSNEVICIGAPDGTVFYTTPSVRRVLGYDPASWYGRNAFEIMNPEHARLAREALRQLAAQPTGAVLRLATQVRHFDGSWKWVEAVLTNMIGQPEIGGIVCNYRDISDSKNAEEERERLLRQIERERAQLMVEYSLVGVLAGASSLPDAAPGLVAALCEQLGAQAGAVWMTVNGRRAGDRLSLIHIHQDKSLALHGAFTRSRPEPIASGRSLASRVFKEKKPLFLSRISANHGAAHHRAAARLALPNAIAFPILRAGKVLGVIELFSCEPFEPAKRLLDVAASVGIQIGLFMERTQALRQLRESEEALIRVNDALERRVSARTAELHEANRELSGEIIERTRLEREIIRVSEHERRRIGEDLHDGVCQELAAIAFMTRALANRLAKSAVPEAGRIDHIARLINDSIARCRDIARGLHPVEMDADGLRVALKDLARRTSKTIPCVFHSHGSISPPESDTALNLYRVAQEAVTNAVKHSRAAHIAVTLGRQGAALRLSVADDGRGISASSLRGKRTGMGLHIMRYRARTMGATLRIHEKKPRGVEVLCLLPQK